MRLGKLYALKIVTRGDLGCGWLATAPDGDFYLHDDAPAR